MLIYQSQYSFLDFGTRKQNHVTFVKLRCNWHCCCSVTQSVWLFETPWMEHARLPFSLPSPRACSNSCTVSQWYHPTISSCHSLLLLPSIFPSIRVFSNELVLSHQVAKVLELKLQHQHQSFQWMISFRIDRFDPLAVQESLKSLLQHHISKASIIWWSAFFMVQLPHLDMTTGPLLAFFLYILPRFVRAFLPRNKCLLISWLQLPSAVTLEPKKIKSVTVSIVSSSICHEDMGPNAMIFV